MLYANELSSLVFLSLTSEESQRWWCKMDENNRITQVEGYLSPTSCLKLWDQGGLLRALSFWVLESSKDEDCTTSLCREASNPTVRKQTAKSKASVPWSGCSAPHLPGRNTSSSFRLAFETNPGWFWLTSLRSSSRLSKQQQIQPGNTNISWHSWKDHREAAGFITRMVVSTSDPALYGKLHT